MTIDELLAKWLPSHGTEKANAQSFLLDLFRALGLPSPGTGPADDLAFEKRVQLHRSENESSSRYIDCWRRGTFVLECKQYAPKERETNAWRARMQDASDQARMYAEALEAAGEAPVMVIACDVGYCFDLRASFDGSGIWRPFVRDGSKTHHRIYLRELADPKVREVLKLALSAPAELDPARRQVQVTKQIAADLAELAKQLRAAGHDQKEVAAFLIRCLFTMFAEDVGLFPAGEKLFERYLREFWIPSPASFPPGVSVLWQTMDKGGPLMTGGVVHAFNGWLFKEHDALPLTKAQLELLHRAAKYDWSEVEPAIFGTLLESALEADERHALGAHFTPRAYVERLVRPTIEEPLREKWDAVQVEVRRLVAPLTNKSPQSQGRARGVEGLSPGALQDPCAGSGVRDGELPLRRSGSDEAARGGGARRDREREREGPAAARAGDGDDLPEAVPGDREEPVGGGDRAAGAVDRLPAPAVQAARDERDREERQDDPGGLPEHRVPRRGAKLGRRTGRVEGLPERAQGHVAARRLHRRQPAIHRQQAHACGAW